MGGAVSQEDGWVVVKGGTRLQGVEMELPGDFSSAAFLIVAALIVRGSELLVERVGLNQRRTGLLTVLDRMGAGICVERVREHEFEPIGDLRVRAGALSGTVVEGEIVASLIDEIPILALAATQAHGETVIRNAGELRKKETDRIATTVSVLRALGAQIEELEDGFAVMGPSALNGAAVDASGDHRIAMMAAVAGLVARGRTEIADSGCIDVSFPGFVETLGSVLTGEREDGPSRGARRTRSAVARHPRKRGHLT
jgi:3-phosphoshikimate 1-carboxyvinyltransferase